MKTKNIHQGNGRHLLLSANYLKIAKNSVETPKGSNKPKISDGDKNTSVKISKIAVCL